ncbi:PaaI family thioesterase [Sphingobium rhizovicinum]|uniref:PaaI family thioesterase n=2 Tax=Sphingomonadaceae TaxID=41297 RepID=A0ABV7N9Y2_9SPHN
MTPDRPPACPTPGSFAQMLDAMMTEREGRFVLEPAGDLIGNPMLPALHGGAITSFLELSAGLTLLRTLALSRPPRLISTHLQFFSAARQAPLRTAPAIRRVGRRVAAMEAEAFQEGRAEPVCTAQFEFALVA